MAFEYNGVVYRDLEPQVRYDAEQVQLLKQADVTINENLQTVNESLQTVNTELNGKLTKPTNPTAESAVTMLADGTVGTKLLSEIGGGGGGKIYMHSLSLNNFVDNSSSQTEHASAAMVRIYSSKNTSFDMSSPAALENEIFKEVSPYKPFPATYDYQNLMPGETNKSATFVLNNGAVAFIFVDNKRYENVGDLGTDTVTEL